MVPIKNNYVVDRKGNPVNAIITRKDYDRLLEYSEELEGIAAYDYAKKGKRRSTSLGKSGALNREPRLRCLL